MNGLSCGEESMTIYSAVLIQYQRVTNGRRDRQTDRIAVPISVSRGRDNYTSLSHYVSKEQLTIPKLELPIFAFRVSDVRYNTTTVKH